MNANSKNFYVILLILCKHSWRNTTWNPRIKPSEIIQDEDIFDITSKILNTRQSLRALINQLIYNTNNKCLILHHKAFRADYILRSTEIGEL